MRAMILAAGLGTRLAPLTDAVPKPVLPVGNRPQILHLLELLRRAGVRETVVNLHHRGEEVRAAVGGCYRGEVRIEYSHETEILGTGGGLKNVERFFGEEPFILANADALMDADIAEAVRRHRETGAAATMIVRDWDPRGGYGRVEVDADGMVRRILGRGKGEGLSPVVFAGIHVLSRKIFTHLPPGQFSCINRDGYSAMLEAGERIASFRAGGYWRDVGTVRDYFEANMDFLRGEMPRHCRGENADGAEELRARFPGAEFAPPVLVGDGCRIGEGSRIGPGVILGDACAVGPGCRLEGVVALPAALFPAGESVSGVVRSPGCSVPVPDGGGRAGISGGD